MRDYSPRGEFASANASYLAFSCELSSPKGLARTVPLSFLGVTPQEQDNQNSPPDRYHSESCNTDNSDNADVRDLFHVVSLWISESSIIDDALEAHVYDTHFIRSGKVTVFGAPWEQV